VSCHLQEDWPLPLKRSLCDWEKRGEVSSTLPLGMSLPLLGALEFLLTFSNVIELLIAILALVKGDIDIVQASMIGSILSNILLVLGMSYFAGGLRFHEQLYALAGAQMHISLLGLSVRTLFIAPSLADF
jgi:calcium/proton exchanger cax